MAADTIMNQRMNGGERLALLLLSVLWGGSFFFAGVLIKTLPPFTIVFLRVALAAVILNALVKAVGMKMPGGSPLGSRFSQWACSTTLSRFVSWSGARATSPPDWQRY